MSNPSNGIGVRVASILVPLNLIALLFFLSSTRSPVSEAEVNGQMLTDTTPSRLVADNHSRDVNVSRMAGLDIAGVFQPPMCSPSDVDLAPETKVIGVEIGGQSRAYVVSAFTAEVKDPQDLAVHVVHDSIGDRSFCVTHCDITHSSRVLTNREDSRNGTLDSHPNSDDLRVGGFEHGMLFRVKGQLYKHHEESLPMRDVGFTTTTWQEWSKGHPETLVYTGKPCTQGIQPGPLRKAS
jgi:hypothetical protein